MPGSDVAIFADDVSKRFRLYRDRSSSLKETVTRRSRGRYEEFWALRDVSLEIERGTTYGLIGHNGSGKSTLLRLMARIHRPTSGRITTKGRISALLELGAGFHPELSGRENVYLNGAILGMKRPEINRVFDEIVDFAGLHQFIDSPVKIYSSGMYVRLGFSVAVHVDPEILIIDEVISVGDEEFQRRCFDYLNQLRRDGVTVVLVSHSLNLMQTMCDRLAWLDHGTLAAEGVAIDVVRKYVGRVDDEEATRLGTEQELGEHEGSRRMGTREIAIQNLELIDESGSAVPMALTGKPITLRLHYTARVPVDDPAFGISIEHDNGIQLSAFSTTTADLHTGRFFGDGYIDYAIEHLPLMPGKLLISVGITDEHNLHCYDYAYQWFEMHVHAGDNADRVGVVQLGGHWDHVPSMSAHEQKIG